MVVSLFSPRRTNRYWLFLKYCSYVGVMLFVDISGQDGELVRTGWLRKAVAIHSKFDDYFGFYREGSL